MNLTNDVAKAYYASWVRILEEFLGWTETRVLKWAVQFETLLNNQNSLLYREHSPLYLTPLLVPASVKAKLNPYDLMVFRERLAGAIHADDLSCEFADEYDWKAAKERVDAVLAEYGESLAQVKVEHDKKPPGEYDNLAWEEEW